MEVTSHKLTRRPLSAQNVRRGSRSPRVSPVGPREKVGGRRVELSCKNRCIILLQVVFFGHYIHIKKNIITKRSGISRDDSEIGGRLQPLSWFISHCKWVKKKQFCKKQNLFILTCNEIKCTSGKYYLGLEHRWNNKLFCCVL